MLPLSGDYGVRERGLLRLMRPEDLIEYDILRAEMQAGVAEFIPQWASVPYGLLRVYAGQQGRSLGLPVSSYNEHPMLYLWSSILLRGECHRWPMLVVSAYEELL